MLLYLMILFQKVLGTILSKQTFAEGEGMYGCIGVRVVAVSI